MSSEDGYNVKEGQCSKPLLRFALLEYFLCTDTVIGTKGETVNRIEILALEWLPL